MQGRPQSVYAVGRLAKRLYALPETREMYRSTLRELLREVWDPEALLAEVERIAALISDAGGAELEAQREFIRARPSQLLAELDAEAPRWPYPHATGRAGHRVVTARASSTTSRSEASPERWRTAPRA